MRTWLRAVVWVTSLVVVSCGLLAQTVTTTNEVRAMRGLGPIEGKSPVSEARPGASSL